MEFTPEYITELKPNEIFVFGSNENGAHMGGAAKIAYNKFGAEWGVSVGRTGQTYAIPTLDRDMERVEPEMLYINILDFVRYVRKNSNLKFYLTKIGCGIAGWSVKEVKKILWEVLNEVNDFPDNLIIPKDFAW